MSKVKNLPETTTLDGNDLVYAVDVSVGTNGGRKITKDNLKESVKQTPAEIKTAYESNADTNAFTDAEQAKLTGIEAGATADQVASEVPFSPTGGIAATNVQAALAELDAEKEAAFAKLTAFNKNFGVTAGTVAEGNDARFATSNQLRVKKNPGTGEYASIATALAAVTSPSASNRWEVVVGPGIYIEPLLVLVPYVTLRGAGSNLTTIQPDTTSHDIIQATSLTEISSLSLSGTGIGYSGVFYSGSSGLASITDVLIANNFIGIYAKSTSAMDSFNIISNFVRFSGGASSNITSLKVESTAGGLITYKAYNQDLVAGSTHTGANILVTGPGAHLILDSTVLKGNATDVGILVTNGAAFDFLSGYLSSFAVGIHVDNVGAGPTLDVAACTFDDCTLNLKVENAATVGSYTGYLPYLKQEINQASAFFITSKDARTITVAKKGGDFDSVKDAMDIITDASTNNRYTITVGPGIFLEDTITMKEYVDISGISKEHTIIRVNAPNKHLIRAVRNSELFNLTLDGTSGTGYSLIYMEGQVGYSAQDVFNVNNVLFGSADTLVTSYGATGPANIFVQGALYGGPTLFNTGFHAYSGTGPGKIVVRNSSTLSGVSSAPQNFVLVHGAASDVFLVSTIIRNTGTVGGNAIKVYDGGRIRVLSGSFRGFTNGLFVENTGAAAKVEVVGIQLSDNTNDINILHPSATGAINGSASYSKIIMPSASLLSVFLTDPTSSGVYLNGKILYSESGAAEASDIAPLIVNGGTMGVISGGVLTDGGGLNVAVANGIGYLMAGTFPTHQLKKIEWATQTLVLPANSTRYVYVTNLGVLALSASLPYTATVIALGKVTTSATEIDYIEKIPLNAHHYSNQIDRLLREALGPVYASGSIVTENGTRQLDVTSGRYFFSEALFTPAGGTAIAWDAYYRSATPGVFTKIAAQATVSNTQYDDGSGTLAAIPAGEYAKHAMWIVGGPVEKYILVYAQATYPSAAAAETAPLPTPPGFITDSFARLASVVVHQGTSSISAIYDERPRLGFTASGTSSTSSHSALSDLSNDDHPQYVRVDGTRAMTGSLDVGGNSITNVNLVDGVDIPAHAARHLPNGADPLATAAPLIAVGGNTANGVGTANSMARSDHQHELATGAPSTITPDQANAEGTSNDLARADHVHEIPTAAAIGLTANSANTEGTGTSFARNDHTHDLSTGAASSLTPDQVNAEGSSVNLARADHIHNVATDAPTTTLSPATANAEGTGVSFARNDHTHAVATALVADITTLQPDDAAAAGTSNTFARGDHKHAIVAAAPTTTLSPATANAEGAGTSFARNDHTHAVATALVTDITTIQPDDAAAAGTTNVFARGDHKHAIAAAAPTITLAPSVSNAEGSGTSFARNDHTHTIATALVGDITTIQPDAAASAGTADTFARGDHRHAVVAAAASSQSPDQANAEGVSTSFARADHIHEIPTAAAIGLNAGSTNTQGSAVTFSRADHTHAIASAAAASQTADAANAVGVSTGFARADHVHNIATAAPVNTGTANAQGTSGSFAKADHVHNTIVANFSATATADTTTASLTDVLLDSMTLTPGAGTYFLAFSTSATNSGNGTERNYYSVYVNGVQVAATERKVGINGGAYTPISLSTVVTSAAGQAVEIRWKVIAGTGTTAQRRLTLVRLG